MIRSWDINPFHILVSCIPVAFLLLVVSLLFNNDQTKGVKKAAIIFEGQNVKLISKKFIFALFSATVFSMELAYFFFFYMQERLINSNIMFADSHLAWFVGMFIGSLALSKVKRHADFIMCIAGIALSLFAITLFILIGGNINYSTFLFIDLIIYFIGGIGSGIYLPCVYAMISRGHSIHSQGMLTGWIDSLRVLGDAVSNIVLALVYYAFFSKDIFIYMTVFLYIFSLLLILVLGIKKYFPKNNYALFYLQLCSLWHFINFCHTGWLAQIFQKPRFT